MKLRRKILLVMLDLGIVAVIFIGIQLIQMKDTIDVSGYDRQDEFFFASVEENFPKQILGSGTNPDVDSFRGVYADKENDSYYITDKYYGYIYYVTEDEWEPLNNIGARTAGYCEDDGKLYFLMGKRDRKAAKWSAFLGKRQRTWVCCQYLKDVKYLCYDFEKRELTDIGQKKYRKVYNSAVKEM